jgi:AraC-like DNA-binding protein
MWREIYGRNIANVDIETIGEGPFHASVTFQGLPSLGVVSGARSAAHYRITRQHLAAESRDLVGLSILLSGASTTQQLGREIVGRPGTAILISGTDPSVSTMHRLGNFVTLVLPRPQLAALVPNLGDACVRPLAPDNEALHLLVRYIETLHRGGPIEMPGLAQAAANHIVDLAALAIGAGAEFAHEAQETSVAAARLQALKADIQKRLGDHDLSAATIAARHGVTPRYVHKLFERDGTTFSAFVIALRLERAMKMLSSAEFATQTISAIAFECGFSDLSYFNRTFRRTYLVTPSEVREAAFVAR